MNRLVSSDFLCNSVLPILDLGIPVIHVDITELESFVHDGPHVIWLTGNENHQDVSSFIRGNTKFIIKSYPYIRDYHPMAVIRDPQKYITYEGDRPFLRNDEYHSGVINIPLGPGTEVVNYLRENPKNLTQDIDLGFYGQTSGIRDMVINSTPKLPNLVTGLYEGFGMWRGEVAEYAKFLKRSKVTLCLTGHSSETFRFSEAIMASSMIISNPLPSTEYYCETTHPIMLLADGKMKILPDENENQLQDEWANRWLDPTFIKRYIETRVGAL